MKKIIAFFLTTVLLLLAFAVPVSAAEKKTCSFEKLIKYAETVEPWADAPVSVLNKSVKIKNTLVMETGDYLVIPRGKTLRLKNGAELDGNIYIENGGKLILEKGWFFVRGTIISDGTIVVYTGGENAYTGGAAMPVSGTLYVSEKGRLIEKKSDGTGLSVEFSSRISRGANGTVVCLGKTNCKYGDIGKTPVSAVVCERSPINSDFVASSVVADSIEALYPSAARYCRQEDVNVGGGSQFITILFDNGSTLSANAMSVEDKVLFSTVCGQNVSYAMDALDLCRAKQADLD